MIGLKKTHGALVPFGCAGREWFDGIRQNDVVYIKQVSDARTLDQNALIWAWNNQIQKHMAECFGQMASADQWHDILVSKLMPAELHPVKLPDSESTYRVGRMKTSKMTKAQLSEYMDKLQAYCAEYLNLILEVK